MSRSATKYFKLTLEEFNGLSPTEKQIGKQLAVNYPHRFTNTQVQQLLTQFVPEESKEYNIIEFMLAKSSVRK